MQINVASTEPASTDKLVIRWWIESGRSCHGCVDYCYEYTLPNGRKVTGGFSQKGEAGLAELAANLCEYGYDAVLEHGHYKQVWVPDE